MGKKRAKRAMDLVGGALLFAAALPAMVLIAAVVKLDSTGPVFYHSRRVGFGGRIFRMHKFRTMVEDAEAILPRIAHLNRGGARLIKIPNDPRVTRIGRALRRTGLDELPQLLNVLRGEMTLVGPRPQTPDEVALYGPREWKRLEVVPGMTGLWQVTARDNPDFDEWVRIDLDYIRRQSLALDLKILLKTIPVALGFVRGDTPPQGVLGAPRTDSVGESAIGVLKSAPASAIQEPESIREESVRDPAPAGLGYGSGPNASSRDDSTRLFSVDTRSKGGAADEGGGALRGTRREAATADGEPAEEHDGDSRQATT